MATTTIQEIYNKAPAASAGDDDILLIAQNEATKGVKLKDATAGRAKKATDAKYAAHLGADGAPLSVGTEETPVYINKNGIPKVCSAVAAATADVAAYAQKIGTPQAHPAIGNAFTPIFINDDGIATACTEIHATLGNAGSAGIPVYTQGNAVRECANFGVCTTATNTMAKAVTINGFVKKAVPRRCPPPLDIKSEIGYISPYAAIAQLVEQWTENPCVVGPIPTGGIRTAARLPFFLFVRRVESPPHCDGILLCRAYTYGKILHFKII